jgi:RNA polymerase sigma-70 factor, ECF subfamily
VRAIRAIGRFTTGEVHKSWLFTILRNIRINELRRQSIAIMVNWTEDTENTVAAADPLAIYTSNVNRNTVQEAMLALSTEHQRILMLRKIEGLSYNEPSITLNVSVGTVMSRLSRARTKLRAMLDARSISSGKNLTSIAEQQASPYSKATQAPSTDRSYSDTNSCE